MKMKTCELIGKPLDWAAASYTNKHVSLADIHWGNYSPSTDWCVGGRIIEKWGIGIWNDQDNARWCGIKQGIPFEQHGPTPLIAAMRCFCMSVFGEEVEIPKELLK